MHCIALYCTLRVYVLYCSVLAKAGRQASRQRQATVGKGKQMQTGRQVGRQRQADTATWSSQNKGSAAFYCTVLYCTLLYCIVLYCTVLYCTVVYYLLLCTVLYCIVLYRIVLYSIVPYCIYSRSRLNGTRIIGISG